RPRPGAPRHERPRCRPPRRPAADLPPRPRPGRTPGPPCRRAVPRLLPDVHRRRPLATGARTLDALVRGLLPRHLLAAAQAHRRAGLARPRRALQPRPGAAPLRPRRARPRLPLLLDLPALVPADERPGTATGADPGGADAGAAAAGWRLPGVIHRPGVA